MSRYHAIATRYDSGLGTVDYTCDSCGARAKSMTTPPGWTESGKSHRCPSCAAGGAPAAFRDMSVAQGADHVMSQLAPDQVAYAADPARGEYRGFAALHDLLDANMLLPFADDLLEDDDEWPAEYMKWQVFADAVMDEVSRRITSSR